MLPAFSRLTYCLRPCPLTSDEGRPRMLRFTRAPHRRPYALTCLDIPQRTCQPHRETERDTSKQHRMARSTHRDTVNLMDAHSEPVCDNPQPLASRMGEETGLLDRRTRLLRAGRRKKRRESWLVQETTGWSNHRGGLVQETDGGMAS